MQSPMPGNAQIPIPWKYSVESQPYHFQAEGFCGKKNILRHPKNPHSMSQVKYHTMGIPKEKILFFHDIDFD